MSTNATTIDAVPEAGARRLPAPAKVNEATEYRVNEALKAHARGWPITALLGKKPIRPRWTTEPPPTRDEVNAMARAGNIGLRTGSPSGVSAIDVDIAKGGHLDGLPITPTVITGSGGRHYYFKAPVPPLRNSVSVIAPHVDVRGEGGQVVFPGSIHPEIGEVYRWAPGLSPDDVPLAEFPAEILELLRRHDARKGKRAENPLGRELDAVRSAPDGTRNDTLNRAAFVAGCRVAENAVEESWARAELTAAGVASGLEEAEVHATIESGMSAGMRQPPRPHASAIAHDTTDERPSILVTPDVPAMLDRAEVALRRIPDLDLYQRGGLLVRIIPSSEKGSQALTIARVEAPYLVELLSRAAHWLQESKRGVDEVLPPKFVVDGLLSRGRWPVPTLRGVIETPTLRPDGSVLDQPGYDPATGLYLAGEPLGERIPDTPDREAARRAAALLREPFAEFPFLAPSDMSVILAAMLTIIARHAIDGPCPMFVVRATTQGTGKTLIVEVISVLTTGRSAPRMANSGDTEEMRKRIIALAVEGRLLILLDNVQGVLDSDALAACLTGDIVHDRILGSTKTVSIDARAVWTATGNNIGFSSDLGRRVIPCDLDAHHERPEDRGHFTHPDLRGWALRERRRFVAAMLTLLRAYVVAGRPAHDRPVMGSFENWDALIRGALLWVGMEDPLLGCERIRSESDFELDALRHALACWYETFQSRPVAVAQVLQAASGWSELRDSLAELAGCSVDRLDARLLGMALYKRKGRIVNGLRFERGANTRTNAARWLVATVAPHHADTAAD